MKYTGWYQRNDLVNDRGCADQADGVGHARADEGDEDESGGGCGRQPDLGENCVRSRPKVCKLALLACIPVGTQL
jgi:hypothetical protein